MIEGFRSDCVYFTKNTVFVLRLPLESDPIIRLNTLRANVFAIRNITRLTCVGQPRVTEQYHVPAEGPVTIDVDGIGRGSDGTP